MPTRGISVRLDEELLAWADRYAADRGSSRTSVLETALRSFRHVVGSPELERKPTREDFAATAASRSELFRNRTAKEEEG